MRNLVLACLVFSGCIGAESSVDPAGFGAADTLVGLECVDLVDHGMLVPGPGRTAVSAPNNTAGSCHRFYFQLTEAGIETYMTLATEADGAFDFEGWSAETAVSDLGFSRVVVGNEIRYAGRPDFALADGPVYRVTLISTNARGVLTPMRQSLTLHEAAVRACPFLGTTSTFADTNVTRTRVGTVQANTSDLDAVAAKERCGAGASSIVEVFSVENSIRFGFHYREESWRELRCSGTRDGGIFFPESGRLPANTVSYVVSGNDVQISSCSPYAANFE